MSAFVLFESASGYALFEVAEHEEIASAEANDYDSFSARAKLHAFLPFAHAEDALENMMAISSGTIHDDLKTFLETNLPSGSKKKKKSEDKSAKRASGQWLGVSGGGIGAAIEAAGLAVCRSDQAVQQILRGIRQYLPHYIKQLEGGAMEKAQLGLGHAYSRALVKFNVHRQDNMIIQSSALLDQIDKDLNTVGMRVKEWYGWHFPELVKIIPDAYVYSRVVKLVGPRSSLFPAAAAPAKDDDGEDTPAKSKKRKHREGEGDEGGLAEIMEKLTEITLDEEVSKQIVAAARNSMGFDISEIDVLCIRSFAERVVALGRYRQNLHNYLLAKMGAVAPNLGALVGETIAARLISHAGSLTRLSKCPASTIQILGAEKALFRALKTKGNTPKYGIIFNSSAIGRASSKNKGRISRYLANKCAIASRIDAFSDEPDAVYGEKLKQQVEERLAFFDSGAAPSKNIDVMEQVKKLKAETAPHKMEVEETEEPAGEEEKPKSEKKSKKSKKAKKNDEDEAEEPAAASKETEEEAEAAPEKGEKEKKKKKKRKSEASAAEDDE